MPVVVNQTPILQNTHLVYDAIMAVPMHQHGPTPSTVDAQWCVPGSVHRYPHDYERYGRPRGTYYEKPPGGPVVTTPKGRPVAPQYKLPAAPRGLPTPGGKIVGPPGAVAPGTTADTAAPKKRNWWPWILAAGGAAVAVAGGR
jgi:hypothetical protein